MESNAQGHEEDKGQDDRSDEPVDESDGRSGERPQSYAGSMVKNSLANTGREFKKILCGVQQLKPGCPDY